MVKFTPTTALDLLSVADRLRLTDKAEIEAMHGEGVSFREVLQQSAETSEEVWSASAEDGLWCVFGFAKLGPILSPIASPWQLGTPLAGHHPAALIRHTQHYVAKVHETYPILVNFVDARNTPSLRYLKAVGFAIDAETQPMGPRGLPFHRFSIGLD